MTIFEVFLINNNFNVNNLHIQRGEGDFKL